MSTTLKHFVSIAMILSIGLNTIVFGQQTNNNEVALTPRQEAIIPISAYAAKGDQVNLKIALVDGLEKGLTVNEIKEVLEQLYAYAGFPRNLNAIKLGRIRIIPANLTVIDPFLPPSYKVAL